ncbi:venom protease-like isoform X1 [Armigeres subalbatus]|uniref:venom protease-like isoform X1 n=1 Tax=Armigeres subalbatus TaxID=124917 RepID=UPI002ED2F4A2
MIHLRTLWGWVTVLGSLAVTRALEGEQCRFGRDDGVCVAYSTCRPVLEALGTRFNICSFSPREAIVCCPLDYRAQLQRIQQQDAAQSVSSKKCKEYVRQSTPIVFLSSLKPNAEVVQKRGKQCSNDNKLIIGGEAAKLGEFPHMAALGYRDFPDDPIEYKCGGTLISDRFVLTAAHCIAPGLETVRLGDLNLVSDTDGATPQEFSVQDTFGHPQYSGKSKQNDIALVQLSGKVGFSQRIRPACLYQSVNVEEQKLIASGYGAEENYGPNSNILMKVVLDQFDQSTCLSYYSRAGVSRLTDSQMCVGFKAGGRDTCQGDSGGPLQVRDPKNDCIFHVVGITSYGTYCGGEVPAIYTRVGSFLPWIESIVWGA